MKNYLGPLVVAPCLFVSLLLAGCAGSSSNSATTTTPTTPQAAAPTVSAISPAAVPAGAATTTLTVTGTGFTASTVVQVNGSAETTTYVSATQVTAVIPAGQLATGALLQVAALNGTAVSTSVNLEVDNPSPTIAQFSPASVVIGSGPTTVAITGTGFLPSTVIQAGTSRVTTYVSATMVNVALTATDFAAATPLALTAVNPTPGGGSSTSASLAVTNPVPTITQLAPATIPAGSATTTITLTGSGFLPSTVLRVAGVVRSTTYVSATQITASLPATDFATAATLALTAFAPTPGGGSSNALNLTVTNPAPSITQLAPASITAGSAATTLTLTGTGFIPTSVVQVNGASRTTTYVSATQLTAALTSTDLATAGTLSVVVTNASPGGGTSPITSLAVTNPAPTITQLTPATLFTGSAATVFSVTGTGFVASTTVSVAGATRSTAYISPTQINVTLTAADLATAGSLSLTVVNATPGGGSASASVPVNNPAPGTISLMPATLPTGAITVTTVTVNGSNFLPSSTIQVGTTSRATTYVSATQLTFQLTVADQSTAVRLSVSVITPTPGGGTSTIAYLTLVAPTLTPIITQASPTQFIVGSSQTTIAVFGSNLTSTSVVQWNGTPLSTVYVTSTYYGLGLLGTVPASLLTSIGTASITVSNPAAMIPVSNALSVTVANPPPPTLTSLSSTLVPVNTATTLTVYGTNFTSATTVAVNGVIVPSTYSYSSQMTLTLPASAVLTPGLETITVSNASGTTAPLYITAYVPIYNNSMIYNPVNGLFYLSVPSVAGAPYGNSIVSVDPVTGALGTPIPVGSEPNRMAITSDGKYLWVALDGADAVRKVDLTAGAAGLQFSIGNATVAALAALPGQTDSVVVSTYYTGYTTPTGTALTIYDSGVARPSIISFATYAPFPYALIVDGTRSEIYGPGDVYAINGNYITYSYTSAGVTVKRSTSSSLNYGSNIYDDVQLVGSTLYTSLGQAVNAETGALLSTFYTSGTSAAQGSITVDMALGKAFIMPESYGTGGSGSNTAPIYVFNTSDNSLAATLPPITTPYYRADYQYQGPTGARLTRWGLNGLAFHGTGGFVSFHTSLVQDISSLSADLGVTLTSSGTNTTGTTTTYAAKIINNGPSAASNVALAAFVPASGVLTSVTPSAGTCSTRGTVLCNLGSLSSGASATVVLTVQPMTAGSATMTAQVSATESDPVSSNNQATSTLTITGNPYYAAPTLNAISPSVIASGSADTTLTVTGTGFNSGSTVLLNGSALSTSFTSSTTLTAVVPAASLAQLGWAGISVSTAPPGGGTSATLPLSVYSVMSLGANHIVYDPYTRKIMAGIGTGSSSIAGNSILAVTPDTATAGSPVAIGGAPTVLSLTSDGQVLYALLPAASPASIARFNMLSQQPDFTVAAFQSATGYLPDLKDIATQPGTENTIAVDEGTPTGISLLDFNASAKTATRRGSSSTDYTGTCLSFASASNLFSDESSFIVDYPVTINGLGNSSYPYYIATDIQYTNCFKINGAFLYGENGIIASQSGSTAMLLGLIEDVPTRLGTAPARDFDADSSLGLAFYFYAGSRSASTGTGITAFSTQTFLPVTSLPIPFSTLEATTGFSGVDMVRWGQDGLAILSATGKLYLVRGASIVPQLLRTNSVATLTAASSISATAGSGNMLLTLTGTNFIPGVAVLWNGSYRTTTIVDNAHVSVAIPASDLTQIGAATITAVNPGASSSNSLIFTVQ